MFSQVFLALLARALFLPKLMSREIRLKDAEATA